MKKVSVFIAGSKELKTERYGLKALAQELNSHYNEKGIDVFVEMKSYEDFKDKQTEYNEYISQTADMALFVLDGSIGKYTKSELITAVSAYNQKQIPEIVVFLKNFEEETSGIREIKDLLRSLFGDHFFYVNYEDTSDLKFKAETRITRFVSPTDHIRSTKKWRMITALLALVNIAILLGWIFFDNNTLFGFQKNNETTQLELFLGGGSVIKYLEKHDSIFIDKIPNAVYLGVPTGDLWKILGEEWYKNEMMTENGNNQQFFPLFFAASLIDESLIKMTLPANATLSENILIFQVYLGDDPIKVYVGDEWLNHYNQTSNEFVFHDKDTIDGDQLESIICYALKDRRLYTTSPNSGTLKAYNEEALAKRKMTMNKQNLQEIVSDTTNEHKVFNEYTRLGNETDFVLLGSENYCPAEMDERYGLYVKDSAGNVIFKRLYMYFVAYKNKQDGEYYMPEHVVSFLNMLNIDSVCWDGKGQVKMDNIPPNGIVELRLESSK